ncbi:MAG: hypothetical protein SCH71_08295 [Desulfobulbaceae bacterium]|nr:hypothetical protein [Desulfobulbaceae bacterium]
MNHTMKMLIGCVVPLLIIFLLPYFGISEGWGVFLFIVLMFGCHLLMIGGHGHDGYDHPKNTGEGHGHH